MAEHSHPIRITLFDEAPLMRKALVMTLATDPRFEIAAVATDAASLLDALALQPCDIVLMDLQLQSTDGVTLLERVRLLHRDVKLAVFTSIERTPVVRSAMRAGADGYLIKRQQPEDVLDGIEAITRGEVVIAPQIAGGIVTREWRTFESSLGSLEVDALRLVAHGATDLQIAQALYVSPRTVQNLLARVRAKAGVQRRTELARWAADNAIV